MDKALDMALDDIIKSKKSAGRAREQGGSSRGRGGRGSFSGGRMGGSGKGVGRHGSLGVNSRPSSFTIAKYRQSFHRAKNFPWQHDLFQESLSATGITAMESDTKLYISNLDARVSNDVIRELFSEIGELKRYAIHFDKNAQPSGSAEVVYAKRSDAFASQKRYNNVQLDGKPMRIEIVTPNLGVPVSAQVNVVGGTNGKATRRVVIMQSGSRTTSTAQINHGIGQRTNGGARNGQARGAQTQNRGTRHGQSQRRGWGHGKKQVDKSAADLDKELEKYHSEGMQT